jgi:small subunit ribosomal protein S16
LSVKIRLSRHGSKKQPYYRIVVTDSRTKRDGRVIEEVGRYNPMVDPAFIQVDLEKVDKWIGNGATPSDTVSYLIDRARNPEAPVAAKAKKPSKKAAAKAAAEAEQAE